MSSVIETKRLVLREFQESDARAAAENSRHPRMALWLPDMVWNNEEDAKAWIERRKLKASKHRRKYAIERKEDHVCIGFVGFAPQEEMNHEIEIFYAIADPYQGCGYACEAVKAGIWQAFEHAGIDMLNARIQPGNAASRRVVEKLGFIYVENRVLPYDGKMTEFEYYRFCHIEEIPNPGWDFTGAEQEEMGEFFNRRAEGYEAHMAGIGWDDAAYRRVADPFPQTGDPGRILDLGCGTGLELQFLWERMPLAHVTCIDLSQGMLSILAQNYSDHAAQLEVIPSSYLDWDYPVEAFDGVISVNTMHHLVGDPKTELYRKIRRSLKINGLYVEADFMVDRVRMEQYLARYFRLLRHASGQPGNGYYHIDIPFTVDVQKELLLRAGFDKVEVFYENIKANGSGAILVARRLK